MTIITNGRNIKGVRQMSADDVSWWANWILVGALLVGVAATYAIVVSGNIKEANLKSELKEKDDALETYKLTVDGKVADAKSEGIKAGEAAGNALVRAAELEKEAASARLETEQIKQAVAWRVIPPDIGSKMEEVLSRSPGSVNVRYTEGDPEAMFLAIQFSNMLIKVKWKLNFAGISFGGALVFNASLPDGASQDGKTLREAFDAAGVQYLTNLPPSTIVGISMGNGMAIPGAPILMIGSRPPSTFPNARP
jgi:hypothetical protein